MSQSFDPPSTGMLAPVIQRAASEAKNATTSATSSGLPIRFNACIPNVTSRPASVFAKFDISVSITPGATAFTRMPRGPRIAAQCLTRVSIAPLVEAYARSEGFSKAGLPGTVRAAAEEITTMFEPSPRAGRSCCTRKKGYSDSSGHGKSSRTLPAASLHSASALIRSGSDCVFLLERPAICLLLTVLFQSCPGIEKWRYSAGIGLPFLQAAEAASLNSGEMHEYILPILTADEAIAFSVVKPLYCS
jgi:hypothetical protein